MAVETPTLFRFDIDTDETEEDLRFADTARDQYHDAHIAERFRQIMDQDNRIEDLCGSNSVAEDTAVAAPVQDAPAQQAPVQQAFSDPQQDYAAPQQAYAAPQQAYAAPQQDYAAPGQSYQAPKQAYAAPRQAVQAGPQLVQDARVTSDLFRAKDTYRDAAPAAPVLETFDYSTAEFKIIGQSSSIDESMPKAKEEEEENEDLVPTMTTRQYGSAQKAEAGKIENIGAAKKSSIVLSKRDKILMFSIIGIVAVLFVLIIVNAAIISGLNSQMGEVEQEYNAVYNEYLQVEGQVQSAFADIYENMDQYAADFGMGK